LVSSDSELPFDYYSMPFCKPEEGIKKSLNSVNPGTILAGSRILNSPYNFTIMVSSMINDLSRPFAARYDCLD
jgi:transmembrane 9 superfamily protein 2/4